jgi:RIO kinase 2
MKLDPTVMRTMERADFRVLEAVESGMLNHAVVPLVLIHSIAGLRHGGSHKILSSLLRDKLLSHERKGGVDGYRLTNAGYDILALHGLKVRGVIGALGQRIGTGKESDVYLAAAPTGRQIVLKFHRLGRTSFRNVKSKRDYFNNHKQASKAHNWLFLSKLSAVKEFSFLKALHDAHYPTPTPLAHNRHVIAMSLVRGIPLYQVFPKQLSVDVAADIYDQAVGLAMRLASVHGLIHCDLNEFNLLVDLSGIQALATDDGNDPYVRHSGQSVAPEKSMGALSKPAWEQSLDDDQRAAAVVDVEAALPEPVARLPNGEPKPVVTLIDFPQMISTRHVNAQEYYERDIHSLTRFFVSKLLCRVPDDILQQSAWDRIMATSATDNDSSSDNEAQSRLDASLRASGFSATDHSMLELYYFSTTPGPRPVASAILEHSDENGEHDEQSLGDDNHDSSDDENSSDKSDSNNHCKLNENDGRDDSDQDSVDNEDGLSKATLTEEFQDRLESLSLLDTTELQAMTREKLAVVAKERVRLQMDQERKRQRQRGAFRKRNSNKTYVKGKRVLTDALG